MSPSSARDKVAVQYRPRGHTSAEGRQREGLNPVRALKLRAASRQQQQPQLTRAKRRDQEAYKLLVENNEEALRDSAI